MTPSRGVQVGKNLDRHVGVEDEQRLTGYGERKLHPWEDDDAPVFGNGHAVSVHLGLRGGSDERKEADVVVVRDGDRIKPLQAARRDEPAGVLASPLVGGRPARVKAGSASKLGQADYRRRPIM